MARRALSSPPLKRVGRASFGLQRARVSGAPFNQNRQALAFCTSNFAQALRATHKNSSEHRKLRARRSISSGGGRPLRRDVRLRTQFLWVASQPKCRSREWLKTPSLHACPRTSAASKPAVAAAWRKARARSSGPCSNRWRKSGSGWRATWTKAARREDRPGARAGAPWHAVTDWVPRLRRLRPRAVPE